jgi:hypothetical protein
MAEFRDRVVDKTFPVAVARAIRSSFGMHGIPIRVVPIAKIRRRELRNSDVKARGKSLSGKSYKPEVSSAQL